MYTKKDMNQFMDKLDGLVQTNDPEHIARYVNQVAAVANTPSIQRTLTRKQRQAVRIDAVS